MATDTMLRSLARYLAALFFTGAGILHFVIPAAYLKIMPPILPAPLALVYVSGAAEVLGGIGMLLPATRRLAGWGLIALLFAVWPVNFYLAWHGYHDLPQWVLWVRVPFQLVFMAWVYSAAKLGPGNRRPAHGD